MMENLLMVLTVALSGGRNLLSKDIGRVSKGRRNFFMSQALLFLGGMAVIFFLDPKEVMKASVGVLPYAVIYGAFLLSSQWLYTFALKTGSVSVCSLVYSFGFILPAVSGAIIWDEPFGWIKCVGIALAVGSILLSVKTERTEEKSKKYFLPLIIAMLSSGGLGIMQKVQQKSAYNGQTNAFLFFAFVLAFTVSVIAFCFAKENASGGKSARLGIISASAGLCFGGANYINTILAGMIESLIFFPLQNIATVVLTALFGMLIFKEKPTVKNAVGFAFGIAAIFILKM